MTVSAHLMPWSLPVLIWHPINKIVSRPLSATLSACFDFGLNLYRLVGGDEFRATHARFLPINGEARIIISFSTLQSCL